MTKQTERNLLFPSHPNSLRTLVRRASRSRSPVVCVAADAPDSGRLAVVSVDTRVSGSLAADLIGRMLRGEGKVAATLSDLQITEHSEKMQGI
jgi:ABC-type sugar transport system substrate-binding protein